MSTRRIGPNVFESGISSAAYFYLYSLLRNAVIARGLHNKGGVHGSSRDKGADMSITASLIVAALAGAGNQLLTMPASVIATRMQESGQ